MRKTLRGPAAAIIASALVLLASCESVPKDIPAGMTAREMIQRAQEASDEGKDKVARSYYETAKARFPTDMAVVCACEYEIAFIAYKRKDYKAAEAGFSALLERYASPDAAFLPQEYKTLAEKILGKTRAAVEAKKPKQKPAPEKKAE
jgi:outer membrane protein assembly factor BamD (BamD/ComL family)